MTTRRKFLKILGGGTIAAAAGVGGFVATRTPSQALAPWTPSPYTDPRKAALSYAILAPNPHNRQPWLIEMMGTDSLRIHRDPDRDLPHTDPFHRQLFIGLGAFLETMVIAASANGYSVDLTLLPEGNDGPVAVARFTSGATPDPLAAQILNRHSNKSAYEDRTLTSQQVSTLTPLANIVTDPALVARLRELTNRAFLVEVETPRAYKESVDLMRVGKAEINENPDGISMRDPMLEALRLGGILTNEALLDTKSPAFLNFLAEYKALLEATPHYAVMTTPSNTRFDQLNCGRGLMRLYLKTTEMGLSLHPVSQALQEFPEMVKEYSLAHDLLAPEGHTVQMLLRLGYGPKANATPRWDLETRIVNDA